MPGLDMSAYTCRLLVPDRLISMLVRASLQRHGLEFVAPEVDADVTIVHTDAIYALPVFYPCVRIAAEPRELDCECLHIPCLCRIGMPFSPPDLVVAVRGMLALSAGRGAPPRRDRRRPMRHALDLCSGSGYSTFAMADAKGDRTLVVGVDRRSGACRNARTLGNLIGYRNVAFVVADATALPFADSTFVDVGGEQDLSVWLEDEAAIQQARAEAERVS